MWQNIIVVFATLCILSTPSKAGPLDSACPDSGYFSGLINSFCWSCVLPFNLMGFSTSDVPSGGVTTPICSCKDDLGVPEFGVTLGYTSPDYIIESSILPWCSPTLGGVQLQSGVTRMGTIDKKKDSKHRRRAQYHYNYFTNPLFKILGIFLVPDCDKDPGVIDLDLAYMSMIDATHYNDLLAITFNPEATAFANPIAQAICLKDCVILTATSDPESQNWFCSGCDGSLYPFSGNIVQSGDMVRATHLIATRALAALHRRGLAKKTYGKDAMCKDVYSPMIPKPMYKLSMAFPKAEVDSWGAQTTVPLLNDDGSQVRDETTDEPVTQSIREKCCHPLGDNVYKWGLGRTVPGAGKDNTAVYNVFRYNDCCIRF